MQALDVGADVFFILSGAVLVLVMLAGFAFAEAGLVRRKNQVNALVKGLATLAISVTVYFFAGYMIAYGSGFFAGARSLSGEGEQYGAMGVTLARFVFLAVFAAVVPVIVSGAIAERAKFWPYCVAAAVLAGLVYPLAEGFVWNGNLGLQTALFEDLLGAKFHDFSGAVVVHGLGGWIAYSAVKLLGPRVGRFDREGKARAIPPGSIPLFALGTWLLVIGWFGYNVMSAGSAANVTGLAVINTAMAMAGGILTALAIGEGDPVFVHNGALAGLIAVSAGSDLMHPIGALITGAAAGVLFFAAFLLAQERWRLDDVTGAWPLHGVCGVWGGIATGIFGLQTFGGMGGVTLSSQIVGSLLISGYAMLAGLAVFGALKAAVGIRLKPEHEFHGADRAVHRITADRGRGVGA